MAVNKPLGDILVVDDTPDNLHLLVSVLRERGYKVRPLPNGKLALKAAAASPPDLILLDINMPQMNGYQVCEQLKANPTLRDIPVIFISALSEMLDKVLAFGVGGVDYITKPFEFEEVLVRIRTHLKLRYTQRQLEDSLCKQRDLEKLRDDLVHMIVHDMRSPLTALLMTIEMMMTDLASQLSEKNKSDMNMMLAVGERLSRMTEDLLDVSRLEEQKMPLQQSICNLVPLVESGIANVSRLEASRTVHLEVLGQTQVVCDENIVRRIVENLVSNGLKHTSPSRPLWVSVKQQTDGVRIAVRDEGQGIPEEFHEKIFDKFGTLKARSEHQHLPIGLGLTFCKLAVDAQGGHIGVDSELGKGSTFWFTLPGQQA